MEWRREGECNRCGDCCVPCPLLRRTDDTTQATCAGHGVDPYYLAGCNVWPSKPEHIAHLTRCSYRFVQVA